MHEHLVGEYAVTFKTQTVGTLAVSERGLMTHFSCTCSVSTPEILRLAIHTGTQSIPLGVLLPDGNTLRLDKSFSKHALHQKDITNIDSCVLITPLELSITPPHPVGAGSSRPPTPPAPEPIAPPEPTADSSAPLPEPITEFIPEPLPTDAQSAPLQTPPTPPVGDDAHIVPPSPEPLSEPIPEPPPMDDPIPLSESPTPPVGHSDLDAPPSPEPQPTLAPSPEWEFIQDFTPIKDESTEETIHVFPAPPVIPPPYAEADLDDVHPYPQSVGAAISHPQTIDNHPHDAETPWTPHPNPGVLFTDLELSKIEITEALIRACGDACIELAILLKDGEPFPLMQIFSLGEVQVIESKAYLVFKIKDGSPM